MTIPEKYDRQITGVVSSILIPLLTAFIVFLFSQGNHDLHAWLRKISDANIITHIITLCVFPNFIIFMLFNHFDMLRALRGVLGITIVWLILVFGIKFLL
jgi:hypothetical protein